MVILLAVLLSGRANPAYSAQETAAYSAAIACLAKKGEVYFSFPLNKFALDPRKQIETLTDVISIDNFKDGTVYAYANAAGFQSFLGYGFDYQVLAHPGDLLPASAVKMAANPADLITAWDAYPTYPAYVDMMNKFGADYPDKCKIIQIGTSGQNRKLLYAKISDNVNTREAEARVMFSSSMHGDETTMYVNMLRMIDYLLANYSTNAVVKKLVDTLEIWICPLENPDGTYKTGDNTVAGAVRYTVNNIDLNRHYPNFSRGAHPDGAARYEPECTAVLKLLDSTQFTLSMNFHGGAELLNYPYDSRSALHEYDAWMKYVYKKYADTVHKVSATYMTGMNNGITNGFAWYQIFGSRMDHITYSRFGREVTAEVSNTKLLPASELPRHWDYNYKSLLQYMEQALYGFNGKVIDCNTKKGLRAKVLVSSVDKDSSFTMSLLPHGDYWRLIHPGTYSAVFSCTGYEPKTVSNIQVVNERATVVNVELCPVVGVEASRVSAVIPASISVVPGGSGVKILFDAPAAGTSVAIYDLAGAEVKKLPSADAGHATWDCRDNSGKPVLGGCYIVRVTAGGTSAAKSFMLPR
jgi:hypothetical protein